jgi:hypothetical protein
MMLLSSSLTTTRWKDRFERRKVTMIDKVAIKHVITYKACFKCTNRKFITRTKIKWKSIIVTNFVVEEFTTILSIRETMIVKWIIDVLKICIIRWLICCLSIDDINAEKVNKKWRIHWWIMQFDDECEMIFECSNEIFAKIMRIVIFKINILL